jgi:hypothetical protein
MGITIGNFTFDGPFTSTEFLQVKSGVYAILGRNGQHENWNVVDVGESGDVKSRVVIHDRQDCWKRRGYAFLAAAAYYCTQAERMHVETTLRRQYNPPCGER